VAAMDSQSWLKRSIGIEQVSHGVIKERRRRRLTLHVEEDSRTMLY
jgi:hypothetical protein